MKVGILGGTFDPIHNAHIEIAKTALNQFNLDKVMIMPTPNPPHKDKKTITSNFHRINMIKLAILPYENIEFSDFEINMHDVTYTADTLYLLNELNPDIEYYFILGSDSIMSFLSWYRPDIILKYAKLLTVRRDDESFDLMDSKIKEIEKTYNTTIGIIDMKAMDISSGFIRTHSHEEIKKAVPESVYKYIIDNDLYTDTNVNRAWSINKITQDLEKELKPSRYTHTLNVAKTAKNMAEAFNVNPNKAYFAGILHDCAKNFSDQKLLQICKDNNLPINVFEERNPSLLHGKVGAFMAKNKYGITDEEILSAITWHTTGKDNMTDLEKIVFCADYIEPGRTKQPHLEELRSIALSDLDMLTFRILEDTVEYLKAKSLDCIDDNTITAYNFYKKLIEER